MKPGPGPYDVEVARMACGIAGRLLAFYDTGTFLATTDADMVQRARDVRTAVVTLSVETAEEVITLCQQRLALPEGSD